VIPQPPSSSERGSAAIEFAISSIVLAMLVFGCIGVAMAYYTYEVVNEYARDASRYAIVHGNGCTIQSGPSAASPCSIGTGAAANSALKTYLNHEILPGINGPNLTVTTTYAPGPGEATCSVANCNGAGDQVTVMVTYPYLYNIPFVPQRAFTMHGTSTMVISQ
jgi:Flp pilus assembly protein TadG